MLQSSTGEERIPYFAVAGHPLRVLAERHLERFAVTVCDLPATAAHRAQCVNFSRREFIYSRAIVFADPMGIRMFKGGVHPAQAGTGWQPATTKVFLAMCKLLPTRRALGDRGANGLASSIGQRTSPRSMRLAQQFWAASRKKSLRSKQLFQNRRVQMGSQQNHTRWIASPTPQTLHKLENPPPELSAGRLYRDVFSAAFRRSGRERTNTTGSCAQAVQARGGPHCSVGGHRCRRRKKETVNLHENFRSKAGTELSFIHSVTTHP